MIYNLSYIQWFFAILYIIIAYITHNYFIKKNSKYNNSFIDDANRNYIAFIILVYPIINFSTRGSPPSEGIPITTKVLMLYIAYFLLFIYYFNLLIYYYKEKNK